MGVKHGIEELLDLAKRGEASANFCLILSRWVYRENPGGCVGNVRGKCSAVGIHYH